MALDQNYTIEIRTTGSDDNGGGFYNRDDGTSVDYSQQDSAQLSLSDLACTTGGTTLTSATGGFTAAMVGNLIQITGGTHFTAGFYEITAHTDTNTVTLDRDPTDGTNGESGTGYVGGALATPGKVGELLAAMDGSQLKSTVYQATGDYTLSSSSANVAGGKVDMPTNHLVVWIGYTAGSARTTGTVGWLDAKPVVSAGSQSSFTMFDCTGTDSYSNHLFVNVEVDANGQSDVVGWDTDNGEGGQMVWCLAADCSRGFDGGRIVSCEAVDCTTGFYYNDYAGLCVARGCDSGFYFTNAFLCLACKGAQGFARGTASFCIAADNSLYGFTGDYRALFYGCLAAYNGRYGFKCYSGVYPISAAHCYTIGNTSGPYETGGNWGLTGFTALTADPFMDRAGDDYRINNVEGGGKELRGNAQGPLGAMCHLDIGAAGQHKDPGFIAAALGRFGVMES